MNHGSMDGWWINSKWVLVKDLAVENGWQDGR